MARDGIHGSNDASPRRNIYFYERDEQELPQEDKRYRVNPSSKLYIAHLGCGTAGCTLNVNEHIERVRYRQNSQTQVRFEGQLYRLRPAKGLQDFLSKFVRGGCAVYVGGVRADEVTEIVPAPFIYVTTREDFQKLREFHPTVT